MKIRRIAGIILLNAGPKDYTVWPDPDSEQQDEARHTARYNLSRLTQGQAYDLASAADTWAYLLLDCPTTKQACERVRQLRRAIREIEIEEPKAKL
jgi:hypothetical protein